MPFEQLLSILVVLLVVVFQLVVPRLRRRLAALEREVGQAGAPPSTEPTARMRRARTDLRAPARGAEPIAPARRTRSAAPPPPARPPWRSPLGSRADVRRAIVLMTILGPCRAFAPADRDRSEGAG